MKQEDINLEARRHSSGEEDNVLTLPTQEKKESPKRAKGIIRDDILELPSDDRRSSPDPRRHTSGVSENSASQMLTSQDWANIQTIKAMRQSSGTEDNLKWSVNLRGQRVDSREAKKQSSDVVEESRGESGVRDALRMDAMRQSSGPDTRNESSRKVIDEMVRDEVDYVLGELERGVDNV